MLDHLLDGRFIFGISPGGLMSDAEVFGNLDADRNAMFLECINQVLEIWASEPPYNIEGKYWNIVLEKQLMLDLGKEHDWFESGMITTLAVVAVVGFVAFLIWELTDGEIERIQENVNRFKGAAACRTDVPSEIFASMIVGTYLLLGMRMSRMAEKPDLAEWARNLHTLIREGSAVPESSLWPNPQTQDRSRT